MNAAIIITGTEILRGLVRDSHLMNLAGMLETAGVSVSVSYFIPDSNEIKSYISSAY